MTGDAPLRILLPMKEVASFLSVSESTLFRWVRQGQFPQPIVLGANTTRWYADEVGAWLSERQRVNAADSRNVA